MTAKVGALPKFLRLVVARNQPVRVHDYNSLDIDPDGVEAEYDSVDDLPEWIARKLAVLSMIDPDDHPTPDVEGVGRRINRWVYWIYY